MLCVCVCVCVCTCLLTLWNKQWSAVDGMEDFIRLIITRCLLITLLTDNESGECAIYCIVGHLWEEIMGKRERKTNRGEWGKRFNFLLKLSLFRISKLFCNNCICNSNNSVWWIKWWCILPHFPQMNMWQCQWSLLQMCIWLEEEKMTVKCVHYSVTHL